MDNVERRLRGRWTKPDISLFQGQGDMYAERPIRGVKTSEIKSVEIGEEVTSIGSYAFNSAEITELKIPGNVKSIGSSAFGRCNNLTTVQILKGSENTLEIGWGAFANCKGLKEIYIGKNISEIKSIAFQSCEILEKVVIDGNVNVIGSSSFSQCGRLQEFTVNGVIKEIGSSVFHSDVSLKTVILPEGFEKLGFAAFYGCTGLEEIIIPKSVVEIDDDESIFPYSDKLTIFAYRDTYGEEWVKEYAPFSLFKYKIFCGGNHLWKEEIIKLPTCIATGRKQDRCTLYDSETKELCSAVKSETIIPAKGHLWDEGVITKEPTCTEKGIRTCTCANCKWTLRKEVEPKGHTYEGNVTKATFKKDGAVSGVCKDCGDKIQREVIPQVTKIELSHTEYTYNGTNRQPKVVLKDRNGKELKAEEYSVVYPEESRRPGTYKAVITLKGNYYEGTLAKEYTVKKGNQVIGFEDMTKRIDSKTVTLKAKILQGNKTGRFGYKSSNPEVASVTSWGRVTFHKVGKTEITAMTRGSANYNGAQKTITLTVAPAPTAITKLQSQNPGWLNIQYRANPDADGYQIQYGTSPDMKGAKYAAVKNAAVRSYTRTDAESGETYYVRVRTYNVVDGERIYSNWSGIKSAEIK